MSVYLYYTGDLVDINTRVSTLNDKILADLDLPSSDYLSTVYNMSTGNVEVSFSISLNEFQINVLNNLNTIILYNGVVQKDVYVVNDNTFNRRSFSVSGTPNNQSDNVSGYSVGSVVTTNSNELYICLDNTTDNAIWEKVFPQETPITLETTDTDFYPIFVPNAATESQSVGVASGLSFNPASNLLKTTGVVQTPSLNLESNGNSVNLNADPALTGTYTYTYPANAPTGNAQVMATLGMTNVFYEIHAANTVTVRQILVRTNLIPLAESS